MKNRIKQIRKAHNLSQVEMANQLGISQSVISLIESGHSSLSMDLLKKISEKYHVSCDWIIYGDENYVKICPENDFIPLVDEQVAAGYPQALHDSGFLRKLQHYKIPGFEKGTFRIFTVSNDNMEPSICQGDKIICEEFPLTAELKAGLIYVLVHDNDIGIARLMPDKETGKLILQHDNHLYRDEWRAREDIQQLWLVRSKITARLIDQYSGQSARLNRMEKELSDLKKHLNQFNSLASGS